MYQMGKKIKFTLYGSSHGPFVGCILEGLPAGMEVNPESVSKYMSLRKPQSGIGTGRKEDDVPEFVSGLRDGVTDGMPIDIRIANKNIRSKDYSEYGYKPRPGHADLPAIAKGIDITGGGPFSGRLTAAVVAGGSVARQFVRQKGIEISAFTRSVGSVKDVKERTISDSVASEMHATRSCSSFLDADMRKEIEGAAEMGDSVGGVTECIVTGLPIGFGGIRFESLDSEIARAMFGIPACKGIEFGKGFALTEMKGSESNDQYHYKNGVKTITNNLGGLVGGMSNGSPLVFRCAFKPTPSISRIQSTVDLRTDETVDIRITGRHDPCIVPRVAVVVESMTALVLADQIMRGY